MIKTITKINIGGNNIFCPFCTDMKLKCNLFFIYDMKTIVTLVLVAMIFVPGSVFGWKSVNQDTSQCMVNCDLGYVSIDSSKPMNFIILLMLSIIVVGILIQYSRTHKYESLSLRCKICKRHTNGLKCVICEAERQKKR